MEASGGAVDDFVFTYTLNYHQKFGINLWGKICQLTDQEKQSSGREYCSTQRVQLKEKQEPNREQLEKLINAQTAKKEEVSQLTKKLQADIVTLKNRQEIVTVLKPFTDFYSAYYEFIWPFNIRYWYKIHTFLFFVWSMVVKGLK